MSGASAIDEVSDYLPIIYVPKERQDRKFLGALVEKINDYFIIWSHWPHDGYSDKEDYEPIILFLHGRALVAIGLRPANRYVFSMTVTLEERKPVVVFDLPWHHPSNFHSDSFRLAAARLEFLHERHEIYTLAEGKPPAYYFAADSGVDIYQWAEERSQEL